MHAKTGSVGDRSKGAHNATQVASCFSSFLRSHEDFIEKDEDGCISIAKNSRILKTSSMFGHDDFRAVPLGLPFHILLGHTPSAVESSLDV